MINILICDDQEIVRKGLNIILSHSEGIQVIGLAEDGEDAVRQVQANPPDVVLMDLKMPRLNGIHATRRITGAFPQVKVIVLTTYDGDEWLFDAIRAGASGYLLKDASSEQIVTAVHDAQYGRVHLDPQIAGKVLTTFQQTPPPLNTPSTELPAWETLTDREQSILELMAQGQNNQEIAATLFLAPGTVKNNVSAILSKLHANDRTQAVLTALRRGLVDLK